MIQNVRSHTGITYTVQPCMWSYILNSNMTLCPLGCSRWKTGNSLWEEEVRGSGLQGDNTGLFLPQQWKKKRNFPFFVVFFVSTNSDLAVTQQHKWEWMQVLTYAVFSHFVFVEVDVAQNTTWWGVLHFRSVFCNCLSTSCLPHWQQMR